MQADVKTFTAFRVSSATAITCVTAQTRFKVKAVAPISAKIVAQQIDAAFETLPIQAVKVGVLCNSAIICAVVNRLSFYRPSLVVVDPVIFSSSGHRFLSNGALCFMKKSLFPLATLLTPNLEEAIFLTKSKEWEF